MDIWAVNRAVFYGALGAAPDRATFVTAMVVAMSVNAALVAIAAAMTWLLPRRAAARQVPAGQAAAAAPAPAMSNAPSPAREHVASASD